MELAGPVVLTLEGYGDSGLPMEGLSYSRVRAHLLVIGGAANFNVSCGACLAARAREAGWAAGMIADG